MANFDPKMALEKYLTGRQATESQRNGLTFLLDALANDPEMSDLRFCSYCLATAWWETGKAWIPVEENGKGAGHPYGKPDPITGHTYYGMGLVQLTWKGNFAAMSKVVGVDLVADPKKALEPSIAYRIMSYGMRNGSFTGVSLKHYFNATQTLWNEARRIINGNDQASIIGKKAEDFYSILQVCK